MRPHFLNVLNLDAVEVAVLVLNIVHPPTNSLHCFVVIVHPNDICFLTYKELITYKNIVRLSFEFTERLKRDEI